MIYLLDTDICIYLIKRRPSGLIRKFQQLPLGDVGISSITYAELRYGVAKSLHQKQNQNALEAFVLPLEIVPFDTAAAGAYGPVRAELERKGRPIGAMDLLIAAHALSLGVKLVTHNIREFERVSGLEVESWV